MKALLIKENAGLGEAIAAYLRAEGHAVEWAKSGAFAYRHCEEDRYDVIVLDLSLPDADGVDILKWLRRNNFITPVLTLTGRLDVERKIRLLDMGADDYLAKPCDLRELEARMRALVRRHGDMFASKGEIGNVIMDMATRSLAIEGKHVPLSRREFRLFELLISRLGQVVPKERLMDQLFGYEEDVGPNAVELYVSRVRQKLRASTLRIETVRCVGYLAKIHDNRP